MFRRAFAALAAITIAFPGVSGAQHTISFQGLLTDTAGNPVADGSHSAMFKLYTVPSGGSAIWTESQSFDTVDGIYDVQLGSVTPFGGVDFTQSLWLGITVSPDVDEMTDRTPLSSVPAAMALNLPFSGGADTTASTLQIENLGDGNAIYGINTGNGTAGAFVVDNATNSYTGVYGGTNGSGPAVYGRSTGTGYAGRFQVDNPSSNAPALKVENSGTGMGIMSEDTVYVRTADLGLNPAARINEDIIVEAFDALIGLYSDGAGDFGSGLELGQINISGELIDKWGIIRRTFASPGDAKSALVFTYGADGSYGENPVQFQFTNTGNALLPHGYVRADSVVYNNPKTGYASVHGSVFVPTAFTSGTTWSAYNEGFYFTGGSIDAARASIQLPHGATIVSMTCTAVDNSTADLDCTLCRGSGSGCSILVNVQTSGSNASYRSFTDVPPSPYVIDNSAYSYYLTAVVNAGSWSTEGAGLIINSVTVEYTLPGAP